MVHADTCNDMDTFISAAKFPLSFGQVPLFKFWQCEDDFEESKPSSKPLTFAGKDVYFNVSILTLFICILIH